MKEDKIFNKRVNQFRSAISKKQENPTKNRSKVSGYFGLMVPLFSVQMVPLLRTLQLLDK